MSFLSFPVDRDDDPVETEQVFIVIDRHDNRHVQLDSAVRPVDYSTVTSNSPSGTHGHTNTPKHTQL